MRCDYFDAEVCSSCTLMGVAHADQLAAKEAHVRQLLAEWPGMDWHAPFESVESGFRNKAKLVVGGTIEHPTLGILDRDNRGVDLRECGLHDARLAAAFPTLAEFVTRARLTPFDVRTGRGELKSVLATVSPDGELMVRFVLRSTESLVRIRKHLPWLRSVLPNIAVVTVNLLPTRIAVPEGSEEIVLTERDTLPMRLGGITLHLRPQSFFQTNTAVAQGLYEQARDWVDDLMASAPPAHARIRNVSLWDLYCGVGGFALHCAGPGREILGVEISPQAIESARLTARDMGSASGSLRFLAGDATTAAREEEGEPDVVVVNPPRRGIGHLAEWINDSGIQHLIYSSCNPVTLAKDLAAMPGFEPRQARVFDMFPQSTHTETMVVASRHWIN